MAWWGWIAAGALLLAAEMGLVDAEFYLVFLGLSALLVGLLALAGLGGPPWVQWLLFAALAATSLVLFRGRVYSRLRPRAGARRALRRPAPPRPRRAGAGPRWPRREVAPWTPSPSRCSRSSPS